MAVQDLSTQANQSRSLSTKLKEWEKKNESLFMMVYGAAVPGGEMFACIYGKRLAPSQGPPAPQPEQVQEHSASAIPEEGIFLNEFNLGV